MDCASIRSRDDTRSAIPGTCGKQVSTKAPEPWLRGAIPDVHPLVMPVFFSFQMVREDLEAHTAGLSDGQVWRKTAGGVLGFHLKHLAGSVDRISTYLAGRQLTDQQLQFLRAEAQGSEGLVELLEQVNRSLSQAEARLGEVKPESIYDARQVGRQLLPSTVL